ncbi:MAG TPA: prepilin peptidase [Gemmataceae bacterium]|nr:prepilin peptidase [Gemmataceae bacterium]
MVYYWLIVAFLLGAVVGSFLNVCIARMPLEKSILWPGSRCGSCLQRIKWYDNVPLLSYLWLRGRCRSCGAKFSPRYLVIEFLTAAGFAALFYAEVTSNIHGWPTTQDQRFAINNGFYPWQWWAVWVCHVTLFSFLMVAAACDLAGREIPLQLTITGTFIGLIFAVLLPWPWPRTPDQAVPKAQPNMLPGFQWQFAGGGLKEGLYPWPVWGPLPDWFPAGSWQLGLATGLAGMLVGTFMLRGIGFLFSKGLGREALGLGDADLMMMAGAFMGWQPVVVAFFLSVMPALVFGALQYGVKRDNELPFGPSLAMGIVLTFLCWPWIGPQIQSLFFWGKMLGAVAVLGALFMLVSSYVIRVSRRRNPEQK